MEPSSTKYERLVKDLLEAKLMKDCPGSDLKVYHNKKYTGKSGHEHQIDVSAELKVAGVRILILVECKFYSHPVGIDDILEFAARIDDIAAHKGVLVTTIGFQDGAEKIAKSKGIALIIAYDLNDLNWLSRCESGDGEGLRRLAFQFNGISYFSWLFDSRELSQLSLRLYVDALSVLLDGHFPKGPLPMNSSILCILLPSIRKEVLELFEYIPQLDETSLSDPIQEPFDSFEVRRKEKGDPDTIWLSVEHIECGYSFVSDGPQLVVRRDGLFTALALECCIRSHLE
jgi:hypothetical protein